MSDKMPSSLQAYFMGVGGRGREEEWEEGVRRLKRAGNREMWNKQERKKDRWMVKRRKERVERKGGKRVYRQGKGIQRQIENGMEHNIYRKTLKKVQQ